MKKVRVNLRRGIKSWSFALYDSVESAFYLKDEPVYGDSLDEEYRKVVTLKPGETIEVEWVGSEWVYEDDDVRKSGTSPDQFLEKFDKVRIGKSSSPRSDLARAGYHEIYSGWLISSQAPVFQDELQDVQGVIRVTPINGRIRSKFDFVKIFSEQRIDDSEPDQDRPPIDPAALN